MTNTPAPSGDYSNLRQAMIRRLLRRGVASGEIRLPAVPGLVDEYVSMCSKIFAALGSAFTPEQINHLRAVLLGQLSAAYEASQRSDIVIKFHSPVGTVLNYEVHQSWMTIEAVYENWVATRTPPLFGTEPDARAWALVTEASDPSDYPVLDIGAGTGRNALAFARRGHPVDVVEVTASFAEMIRADAERESLDVRVYQTDVFESTPQLRHDYQMILLSGVVPEFRTPEHLRRMFELADTHLGPGGVLVFDSFVARRDFTPDAAVRQMAEQTYSKLYTWDEMESAAAGYSLQLIADDAAYDYEKEHLPAESWPPTSWFPNWAAGQDLFDLPREQCPNELRWLVYQKPYPTQDPVAVPAISEPEIELAADAESLPPLQSPGPAEPAAKKPRRFGFRSNRG